MSKQEIDKTENPMRRDTWVIVFLYSISYWLLLININGIYWDDWTAFNQTKDKILDEYIQAGRPLRGFMFFYMLKFGDVWIFRATTFAYYLVAGLLLNKVLKNISQIEKQDRILLVLFFILLPFNSARISLVINIYSFCYMLFFIALWLFANYLKTGNLGKRILALILFYFSFLVSSILPFYILVLFYFVYFTRKQSAKMIHLGKELAKNLDFWALPFLFWITKKLFFNQFGYYESLNEISPKSLLFGAFSSLGLTFITLLETLIKIALQPISLITGFFVFLVYFVLKRYSSIAAKQDDRSLNGLFLLFGFVMIYFAVFAYGTVGKFPSFDDWSSRNQLLLPLGTSFVFVYGLRWIKYFQWNRKSLIWLYSILLALFIVINNHFYFDFFRDWAKQVSLVEHFRQSALIKENRSFLVLDETVELNATNRTYRFYEYSALMKQAYGDEKRYAEDINTFDGFSKSRRYRSANFPNLLSEFKEEQPSHLIIISQREPLNFKMFVRLLVFSFIDKDKYESYATRLINIRVSKM